MSAKGYLRADSKNFGTTTKLPSHRHMSRRGLGASPQGPGQRHIGVEGVPEKNLAEAATAPKVRAVLEAGTLGGWRPTGTSGEQSGHDFAARMGDEPRGRALVPRYAIKRPE